MCYINYYFNKRFWADKNYPVSENIYKLNLQIFEHKNGLLKIMEATNILNNLRERERISSQDCPSYVQREMHTVMLLQNLIRSLALISATETAIVP